MGMTINNIGATPLATEQAVNGVPQAAKNKYWKAVGLRMTTMRIDSTLQYDCWIIQYLDHQSQDKREWVYLRRFDL